ncbi:MAG: helix-turn-helix domain-containing protein [Desulforegulaceae bacterium]|nr:helix-turn-helix domain-containing protein [Desulforegulaceae bacterium]
MAHITLLAYPNCSISNLTCPIDSFGIANLWHKTHTTPEEFTGPLFTWDIVTPDGRPVDGFGGLPIYPNKAIHEIEETDVILIPGILPPIHFIGNLQEDIKNMIMKWHEREKLIGTICTGSFLLAETGLLDGHEATTNWAYANYFQKLYPKVNLKPERILTLDNNFVCSGATTAFMDLCLYFIEKFGSSDLSAKCAKLLLIDSTRKSQAPYFIFEFQKDHSDDKILNAQTYMEKNISGTISFDQLAKESGISPRHFKRRFKNATGDSPQIYLQRLRVEEAKKQLETSFESFEKITWNVGYENSNSFRRLFKKTTGLNPLEYRKKFNSNG